MAMSRALSSSSDESSVDASTGPTTPEWSPYIIPQHPDRYMDSRLGRMNEERAPFTSYGLGPAALTEEAYEANGSIRNVCVIGAGYVGGPTAAVLALHNPGVKVTVLDRDSLRIASWKSRHLPIHEPGLDAVVRLARDGGMQHGLIPNNERIPSTNSSGLMTGGLHRQGNLFFSTDSAGNIGSADIIFLAVNTPTKYSGRGAGSASDLSALESATRDIAKFAKNGTIIVEKSTVPCGTARLISNILSSTRPEEIFPILSNPEFLAEGSAVKNLQHPDRVLIGSAASVAGRMAAKRLGALYANWVPEDRILYTNLWSSELAKLVANAMLAQRISSINSISALCERTGADVREIARAIGTDGRIGSKFLKAGLGFGGSCFRKDISSLVYISESLGLPDVADYWRAVLTMNMFQRSRFTDKIVSRLNNTLNGKKVLLLGFAYKKDTGDTRESLAVDVIGSLLEERPMEIAIFDPCCPEDGIKAELAHLPGAIERVRIYTDPYVAAQGASAVAVLTEWDFFKSDRAIPISRRTPAKPAVSDASSSVFDSPLVGYTLPAQILCPSDCKLCSSGQTQALFEEGQRLDWVRVGRSLRGPKYVIDGRGILDERSMKISGLEVEGLGWGGFGQAASQHWG